MAKKILFVAEAVALAHVSRPLVLAEAMQSRGFEIVFAVDERATWILQNKSFALQHLASMPSARFLDAISRGAPLYDYATLRRYVRDDLALIERVKPDLIVGDLRLSLSVSARLTRIPYAAIANAYWSPFLRRDVAVMPPLMATRAIPLSVANALFKLVRPLAFSWHAIPLNRVRRNFGLAPIAFDVRNVYTDADYVLYADVPELFPLRNPPPTHHFLGPILWSPPTPVPVWWDRIPRDKPLVYMTLGSSGRHNLLPFVFDALATLPVRVMVATAGAQVPLRLPANMLAADYLPGAAAASMAALVVCNGGAPTSQQALAAGVPVLGIASNMDQILHMQALTEVGVGISLRGERTDARAIRLAASKILEQGTYAAAAKGVATLFDRYCATERFGALVSELLA